MTDHREYCIITFFLDNVLMASLGSCNHIFTVLSFLPGYVISLYDARMMTGRSVPPPRPLDQTVVLGQCPLTQLDGQSEPRFFEHFTESSVDQL